MMRTRFRTIGKVAAWVLFGAMLLILGILVGTVRVLTPQRLTPMAVDVANRTLNADVSMSRVELSLRESFPFLSLDIDSMVIVSRDMRRLPAEARDTLPVWADTLAVVDHLHGGINLLRACAGVIDLSDVEIHRPQANLLVVNDSLNNFTIVASDETAPDTTATVVPDIRLNHFSLINPRPIRYADIAQDTHLTATIRSAELTNNTTSAGRDGDAPHAQSNTDPVYRIDFDSNLSSPLLDIIGQRDMPVGFDGLVEWRHQEPYLLRLRDFDFAVSALSGRINTCLDFDDGLTVREFDFGFDPLRVAEFLAMVPDSLAAEWHVPKDIDTDAEIDFSGRLDRQYVLGSTDLPYANLHLALKPCYVKYHHADVRALELDTDLSLVGGTPDDAVIDIRRFRVEGPATALEIKGRLTSVMSDPMFDGDIDGDLDLSNLPRSWTRHLCAGLRGRVTASASVIARQSMLSRDGFHRLRVAGDVRVDRFYYLADDTLTMYYLNQTKLHFGTHERFGDGRGVLRDSLLAATVDVDSADLLVSGLDMRVSRLHLGVGAQSKGLSTDTTLVIPMSGGLRARGFSLFSITDSAGVRFRDIQGNVSMQRFKDDAHLPLFNLNLALGDVSAGNNHTRFMISDGALNCSLAKLPVDQLSPRRREVRHLADSLRRCHPDLPVDSVYVRAIEIRNRNRRPGHHRVHAELTASDNEIIDWGTSSALTRLLLDWDVKGQLRAQTARLFTAAFPVRNRLEGLKIRFNNDSILMSDLRYKAGRSDFLISGNITNMRRALTSRRQTSPLRINFNVLSDFIDINELAGAFFKGASNSTRSIGPESADERSLEHSVETAAATDTVGPVLIPTNIDAELKVRAGSVEYADFVLNDLQGTVLMYDGALSLHDLTASSDVGSVNLSALYSAASADDMDFGFGMKLNDFNIHNFLKLVPAIDSLMPVLHDLSGIIDANLALTTRIDRHMDLVLPSIQAAINLDGDSLSFVDSVTFKKIAKWLLFKDKNRNMIDHVSAQMIVENGEMRIFPFIFDFDRYKLGVQGSNDFDMNFNYHIAVLKSPIPFAFGVNIKGNYDKLKIRFGGAKFNEKTSLDRSPLVNNTRINLINQFQGVFRRGVRNSKFAAIDISDRPLAVDIDLETDTLSSADSAYFRAEGLMPDE